MWINKKGDFNRSPFLYKIIFKTGCYLKKNNSTFVENLYNKIIKNGINNR